MAKPDGIYGIVPWDTSSSSLNSTRAVHFCSQMLKYETSVKKLNLNKLDFDVLDY